MPDGNNRPWFRSTHFTSLVLTKYKSISSRTAEQQHTITDPVIIASLADSIQQIPSNGDMMVSWGPDAEYFTLSFEGAEGNQCIEIIQKRFKTPSTGFNSRNQQETELYLQIERLLFY